MNAKYVRLYTDNSGESHFQDIEEQLAPAYFVPPASPLNVSEYMPASAVGFLAAPSGWFGDWHPSPGLNLFFVISGEWEVQASDGEIRAFGPGSILRVEDTTGKGHRSRVIGSDESLAGIVLLAN